MTFPPTLKLRRVDPLPDAKGVRMRKRFTVVVTLPIVTEVGDPRDWALRVVAVMF